MRTQLFGSVLVFLAGALPGCGGSSSEESVPPAQAAAVVTGYTDSCFLFSTGTVKCWGDNSAGQLGIGNMVPHGGAPGEMGANLPAVDLGTGRKAVAVSAGGYFNCARFDDGTAKCWGLNESGQLGQGHVVSIGAHAGQMGDVLLPIDVGTGRTVARIVAGGWHTCALLDHGAVKCWGKNDRGQLGLGDTTARGSIAGQMGNALPAVDLGTGRSAVALALGGSHTCALLDHGTVKCWGFNIVGQLGLGDTANRGDGPNEMGDHLPAVDLGAGRTAVALSAGDNMTCAILDNGAVKCWGSSFYGELGLGDTTYRGDGANEMGDNLPTVDLGSGRTAVALSSGRSHTCARLDNGSMKCWGHNGNGSLGLGDNANRGDGANEMGDLLPAPDLGTGRSAVGMAAGGYSTCALLDDSTVKCWGNNDKGQLGLGDSANRGLLPGEMGDALPIVDLVP